MRSSNEEHLQNKRAYLDDNFYGGASIAVKSRYLALHKLSLDGAFVRANIYKFYLLHSHARNNLIIINNIIIIINYYHHYDLQEILNFIIM